MSRFSHADPIRRFLVLPKEDRVKIRIHTEDGHPLIANKFGKVFFGPCQRRGITEVEQAKVGGLLVFALRQKIGGFEKPFRMVVGQPGFGHHPLGLKP